MPISIDCYKGIFLYVIPFRIIAPTTTEFNFFLLKFEQFSQLTMCTKGSSGYLFCLDLKLLIKM